MSEQPVTKQPNWGRRCLKWGAILLALMMVWVGIEHLRGRRQLKEALQGRVLTNAVWAEPPEPMLRWASIPARLRAAVELADGFTNVTVGLPPTVVLLWTSEAIPSSQLEWWADSGLKGTNDWRRVAALMEQARPVTDRVEALLAGTVPVPEGEGGLRGARGRWDVRISQCVSLLEAKALLALRDRHFADALRELRVMEGLHRDMVETALAEDPSSRWAMMTACRSLEGRIGTLRVAMIHSGVDCDELVAGLEPESLVATELEAWKAYFREELVGWASWFRSREAGRLGEDIAAMWSPSESGVAESAEGDTVLGGFLERALEAADKVADPVLKNVAFPVWRLGWGDQSIASLLRQGDAIVGMVDDAGAIGAFGKVPLDDPWGQAGVYQRSLGAYGPFESPSMGFLFEIFLRETSRRLDRTAIAILRFHAAKGRYPDSLDQLVPEYLTKVPMDPWSAAPLRYRLDANHGFRLHSVGNNRVDEGGVTAGTGIATARMLGIEFARPTRSWGLDIVWPGRATPEQKQRVEAESRAKWDRYKAGGASSPYGLDPELMKRYGLIPRVPKE